MPPANRRWLRYSLRSLVVVITAAAVVLGVALQRARTRRGAAVAVLNLGGSYQGHGLGPEWLRPYVDDPTYFVDVFYARFNPHARPYTPFGDEELSRVVDYFEPLENFRELALANCTVTDDGLQALRRLDKLEELTVHETPISDAGLERLHDLSTLRKIELRNTRVTAAGVARLRSALPAAEIVWDQPATGE